MAQVGSLGAQLVTAHGGERLNARGAPTEDCVLVRRGRPLAFWRGSARPGPPCTGGVRFKPRASQERSEGPTLPGVDIREVGPSLRSG